jgi:tetratricopeptide (TPR) repeat protein/transcriptional regulator with XRE-family HTH domain
MSESQAFGDLLRRHRVLAGMSQEELAERAHLSARAISDLERGVKRTPRRDTVQLLVEALGLSGEARTAFVTAAREPAARRSPKQASQPLVAVEDGSMYPRGGVLPTATQAPATTPTGGFLGAVPEGSLIGRETELSAILAAIEAVVQGSGRLLAVAGEPGVGKTRISQEATLACRDRGFIVATGRCYEPHQSVPYYPLLEALTLLYGAAPDPVRAQVPTRWPQLMRLLPEQQSGALPATDASPQEEQQRLFWAVTGFLQAISEVAPVALLLDDLHWADDASLDLLQHLARHTRAHRVLLLGTYRDVEVGRQHPLGKALHDLERERLLERIRVRRLGHEGTVRLIADRMGQDLSDEFAELVYRHTDGHPLFVHEVLRALIERGDVYRRDGRWESRGVAEIGVPESVRATIADRVSRLSEHAQQSLREASVLGQAFDFEDLQAIANVSEDELEAALEEALAAGLVYESGDGYVFSHALTQQALYTELPKRRRRRLHLAVAEALERLAEPVRRKRAAELAGQFREGGAPERAFPYTLLAGDHAVSVYAPTDAERYFREALRLARALDDRDGEARVLEKLGWLMWITARFQSCLDALEQSARLYREAGDVEGEMRAVGLLGMVNFTYAPLEGAQRIRALLDRLGSREPSIPLVSLYSSLSMNLVVAGRYREVLEAAKSATEIARALGDEHTLASVETMRGTALGLMGRLGEARRVLEERFSLSEAANDYWGQLSATHYLGKLTVPQGDFDAALHYHSRALELAQQLGARSRISAETSNLSEVLFYLGDWAQARNNAEYAVQLARSASSGPASSYFQYADVFRRLGMVRGAMGEWEDALPCLQESLALAEQLPYPEAVRSGHGSLAEQELLQGKPEAALARLEPLVERSDPEELGVARLLPYLAWAYLELEDDDRAEDVVQEGIDRTRAQGNRLTLVELLRVRGMVLARRRRWDEAERMFEEAVSIARSLRNPYAEARTLYERGLMCAGKLAPKQSREQFEAAAAIFQRLGSRPYSEMVQKAMAATG